MKARRVLTVAALAAIGYAVFSVARAGFSRPALELEADAMLAEADAYMAAVGNYRETVRADPRAGGGFAPAGAGPDERAAFAAAECARAVELGLVPARLLDTCTAGVLDNDAGRWTYRPAGTRMTTIVEIGRHRDPRQAQADAERAAAEREHRATQTI